MKGPVLTKSKSKLLQELGSFGFVGGWLGGYQWEKALF